MRIYVVQTGTEMLVNNQRCIKIGYYHQHADQNVTKYYLAASEQDDLKVTLTEVSESLYKTVVVSDQLINTYNNI